METNQVVKIGVFDPIYNKISSYLNTEEKLVEFLSEKGRFHGRLAVKLADYLVKHSKNFDSASFLITDEIGGTFPNGTFTGLLGFLDQSEIDIVIQPFTMTTQNTETFAYPFKLYYYTFMTRKSEYMPQVIDIFHTFSTSVWIAIFLFFIIMLLIYYATLKRKYSFNKILIHLFAVFLKQDSIVRPFSIAENLLVYSLVAGAMFLGLFYESTVLSFLTIPPINQINDVSQLA